MEIAEFSPKFLFWETQEDEGESGGGEPPEEGPSCRIPIPDSTQGESSSDIATDLDFHDF